MSRFAVLGAALPAAALAALLSAGHQLAVLPSRRREFEPGTDLNHMLDDAGRHAERKSRKAERRGRLQAAQRAAAEGRA